MTQASPRTSDRDSARHLSVQNLNMELDELLLRRLRLRDDIARMHELLKGLAVRAHSRLTRLEQATKLERACRIALMETNEPASIEMVYDRIARRGSITSFAHKRTLRAIENALDHLVESGEAAVVNEAGTRRWRWLTEPGSF